MPIPIGVLAQAGAGGAAAEAFELIQTITLTNDTTQTLTISNIPQTYKNLKIVCSTKMTPFANNGSAILNLNGITSSSYTYHGILGTTSVGTTYDTPATRILIESGLLGTNPANLFLPSTVEIVDYSNSSRKPVIRVFSGNSNTTSFTVSLYSGFVNSTGAISSFSFGIVTSNPQSYLASNTSFSVYGLRG